MSKLLIDLPETIETDRLILQMPKAGFGKKLHQAIIDGFDDGVKWLNWPSQPPSIQECEEECRKHHCEFILKECIRYLILDKTTNDVVGRGAFPSFLAYWAVPQFGISYFIRKNQRSKGYGSEAVHALTKLAFQVLKAKKVEIYCDAENIPSNRIAQKLGYTLEYIKRGGWPRHDDTLAFVHSYAIFSEQDLKKSHILYDYVIGF